MRREYPRQRYRSEDGCQDKAAQMKPENRTERLDRWADRAVVVADVFFLASLVAAGALWWMKVGAWTVGTWKIHFSWSDRLLWGPAFFLLFHVVVAAAVADENQPLKAGLFRQKAVKRFMTLFLSLGIPIVAADRILQKTHMDVRIAPMVLEGKTETGEHYHKTLLRDPELLWKFEPGSRINGRVINRMGFRGREVHPEKIPGVHRVICLGDSVTAQGQPGYAEYLHEMLTNAPPRSGTWEAFALGVYGYSSQQGHRLLQIWGPRLRPDIVTIAYGRNDHNKAEMSDQERMGMRVSPWRRAAIDVVGRRTVGRMLLHAMDRHHQWTATSKEEGVRVAPKVFRENLRLMVRECRDLGAQPVLLTAPRRAIPQTYVKQGYATSTKEFEQQHDAYAQIVREVAAETGATLVDLQQLMSGPECDRFFAADAVHFDFYDTEQLMETGSRDQPGLRRIAKELYAAIRAIVAK